MEDFIFIIIMLLKSDEGLGSGKNHVLDIFINSYVNGLGAVIKSPLYNFLTFKLNMNSYSIKIEYEFMSQFMA